MKLDLEENEVANLMNSLISMAKSPGIDVNGMKYIINLHDKIAMQMQVQNRPDVKIPGLE
jgi:uncharacterized protein (UPF0335 family)